MADRHDSIRAALDYDVIIRDALAGVPNSAINDLVERLADVLTPKPRRDPLTVPIPSGPPCAPPIHGITVMLNEFMEPGAMLLVCGSAAFARIKSEVPNA